MKKNLGLVFFLTFLVVVIFISPKVSFGQEGDMPSEVTESNEPAVLISAPETIQPVVTTSAIQARTAPATMMSDNGQILEKIPSPDQIRYFRVIKKENGSLYGIRLQTGTALQSGGQNSAQAQTKVQEQTKTASGVSNGKPALTGNANQLEKIPAPQFIKDYEKIQKIGTALWGIKKPMPVQVNNRYRVVGADIKTCVSQAITAKDEALKKGLVSNNAELVKLIDARQACQLVALEVADGQGDRVAACNRDFQTKHQQLLKDMKNSQADIWQVYKNNMQACLPDQSVKAGEVLLIEDGGSGVLEAAASL